LKEKNISKDPRVAISVVDHNNPFNMVSIRGRVAKQITEGANERLDKLAKKYMDVEIFPYHSPNITRVILKIIPEKVVLGPPSSRSSTSN